MTGFAADAGANMVTQADRLSKAMRQDAWQSGNPKVVELAESRAVDIAKAARAGDVDQFNIALAQIRAVAAVLGPVFSLTAEVLKTIFG